MVRFKDLMKSLQRNIKLYGVLKIFTKRVFLPLSTIYWVEVAHLSIAQIGILATVSAVVSLISEIPTGYFADRMTRKSALVMAGVFAAASTLMYIVMPSFTGAILATTLEAIGYSFLTGAAEALIHDTLAKLGEPENYPKVVGRAQSLGLMGNMLLVGLVPLTYSIDPRLPFLCGTISYLLLILVALGFDEPPRERAVAVHVKPLHDLISNLRVFVFRSSILIFIAIGILSALYTSSSDFTNLIFKDLGLNPSFLGLVFAAGSGAAIIGGYFIHLLRHLSIRTYAIADTMVVGASLISIGAFHNLWVTAASVILSMGWWRLRSILYQYHLLTIFHKTGYKATLISTLSFFIRCNEAWLPFVFVASIGAVGFYAAYTWIGAISTVVLIPMFLIATNILTRHFGVKKT